MATEVDTQGIQGAYDDVRNDSSDTNWALFKYNDNRIAVSGTGVAYDAFLEELEDNERAYGYVRFTTGDELSKRCKFAFIIWVGSGVNPLKRAKVSTDKSDVKKVIKTYAVEVTVTDVSDLEEDYMMELITKAGGANYGTGQ